ncbi:MAG: CehA/McbA family metallohydrolase [Terriglobales bacterium]
MSFTLQDVCVSTPTSAPLQPDAGAYPNIASKRKTLGRIFYFFGFLFSAFVLIVGLDGFLTRLPSLAGTPARGERIGVIHVHTNASCGSGSLPQVISAAKDADLSFLAITDHNLTLSDAEVAAADPPEFAVIDGEEVSTGSGHYLALGVSDSRWKRGSGFDARALMASSRSHGAVNFIAHPYGLRDHWSDWGARDYDGIEIFNDDAIWRKNKVFDIVVAALLYPVNSRLALLRLARTPNENFAKWDELLAGRPVAGICGSDAHANLLFNRWSVAHFPSYLSVFSLARQHVLLSAQAGQDPDTAGAGAVLAAIKSGNSFCAVDALSPADGFTQTVTAANLTAGPGNSIEWRPGEVLHVQVPAGSALIRVLRDGHEIAQQEAQSLDVPVPGPGRYRTEAYLRQPGLTGWHRWTLWIFANPIYVTSDTTTPTTSAEPD